MTPLNPPEPPGPTRTCIGCRRRAAKSELLRLAPDADGHVRLDPTGHAPGRGAYVCSNVGCLQQAIRKKRIGAALRVAVDAAEHDRLMEEFSTWPK